MLMYSCLIKVYIGISVSDVTRRSSAAHKELGFTMLSDVDMHFSNSGIQIFKHIHQVNISEGFQIKSIFVYLMLKSTTTFTYTKLVYRKLLSGQCYTS